MDVAFTSNAFTRTLYKGLLQIKPIRAIGLPDEDNTIEGLTTGGGTDAYLSVAALEGKWEEDVRMLEKEQYHQGVRDLSGAAHVGRSTTAWANVNENKSKAAKKKTGKALPYHIPSGWGRDGQAVWPDDEDPFYLYLQDPASARLIFSLMDDDVVGEGSVVGSAHRRLSDLIPEATLKPQELIDKLKGEMLAQIKDGNFEDIDLSSELSKVKLGARTWEGTIKLTSKPKLENKNGQIAMGVAAGAALAGPMGAAVGGALANMYEGEIKGRVEMQISYLPFPPTAVERQKYIVLGGMPGINWGDMYEKYVQQSTEGEVRRTVEENEESEQPTSTPGFLRCDDLEQCFYINHRETGGSCVVYRSLNKKLIVVSFRGTCVPKDLVTDVSLVQEPWVAGEDPKDPTVPMVHAGFRTSMESISRRLKELVLAAVAPGDNITDYDMLVTGHSLGGALATLFTADIGEYGIDAGRALPQLAPSDPWWKSIANTFMGQEAKDSSGTVGPPRPKSLRMYNYGSPRVGNDEFAARFDALLEDDRVEQAYRIVNGDDIVTRVPRTTNAVIGSVNYEHVGKTVMISVEPTQSNGTSALAPALWVEGESDEGKCPVRDLDLVLNSPTAEGTLLGDLIGATAVTDEGDTDIFGRFSSVASKWSERVKNLKASDLASIVGIDREFSEREFKIIESFATGRALANHMEDNYYAAIGRASGLKAVVGEDIAPLEQD